jgi:hypothetical protein
LGLLEQSSCGFWVVSLLGMAKQCSSEPAGMLYLRLDWRCSEGNSGGPELQSAPESFCPIAASSINGAGSDYSRKYSQSLSQKFRESASMGPGVITPGNTLKAYRKNRKSTLGPAFVGNFRLTKFFLIINLHTRYNRA